MFNRVPSRPVWIDNETKLLETWKRDNIAAKSMMRVGPKGPFVFYEGPPTANGRPGIHHVGVRTIKDLICRFRTMQGYTASRRTGWDTHGLAVEVEVEKKLGFAGKGAIEKFGVEKFNEQCRESVFTYMSEWRELTDRIAYWADHNGYITYNNTFIETEWWILKTFFERGQLFEGYRTSMHCPRCNTTLASHEVAQGMAEDVDDPSIWVKFGVTDPAALIAKANATTSASVASLLIWTTTPWTLGANVAVAAKPTATYSLVEASSQAHGGETQVFVVAQELVGSNFGDDAKVIGTLNGNQLAGTQYAPIFSYGGGDMKDTSKAWHVIADDFVSLEDGTGLVHIAPAYGDLEVGQTHGLPTAFSVNQLGEVIDGVKPLFAVSNPIELAGMFFKAADDSIMAMMDEGGVLYKSGRVSHAYPLCWRDDTPLLFFAKNSWYIATSDVRDQLVKLNAENINWIPDHVGTGRFGNWLENNVDWAISRERFWGTPLPIWISEDKSETVCVGSVAELSELTGRDLSELDLHRPFVDDITFVRDAKTFKRVPYVLDAWFDSGSMPLAQWHYPFENEHIVHDQFPADYICEAIDQTRGWFYSLHAIATLLTDPGDPTTGRQPGALHALTGQSPAFKNCIVTGHLRDAEGKKMSKSRGNGVNPWDVIDEVGVDAIRWYLVSGGPSFQNINFDLNGVRDSQRGYLMTLWSSYAFFTTYAALDNPDLVTPIDVASRPIIDQWLASRVKNMVDVATEALEAYDVYNAARVLQEFVVDDLSNWYIRLNRSRFWQNPDKQDQASAYRTVFEALETVMKLTAPITPFVADEIYANFRTVLGATAQESVHLDAWPTAVGLVRNEQLEANMDVVRKVVELGRAARSTSEMRIRQPLPNMLVRVPSEDAIDAVHSLTNLIKAELNVRGLEVLPLNSEIVDYTVKPNFRELGKRLGDSMQTLNKQLGGMDQAAFVKKLQAGESIVINLDGLDHTFGSNDFVFLAQKPEGFSTAEDGAWLVALDTRLTPELIEEGVARDVIRMIQSARKTADLQVSDRICVGLVDAKEPTNELPTVVANYLDRIAREVLADQFTNIVPSATVHTETVEIDGFNYELSIALA